ncbi:MAG: ATP-binding protein [Desulfuromonadales bacterium]
MTFKACLFNKAISLVSTSTLLQVLVVVGMTVPGVVCAVPPPHRLEQRGAAGQQGATIDRDLQPRRPPPRPAIEACNGKKEGDPCSVMTPRGLLEGVCLSGAENVFACRPGRTQQQDNAPAQRQPQSVAPQESQPAQKPEPRVASHPAEAPPPPPANDATNPSGPPAHQQPVNSSTIPDKAAPIHTQQQDDRPSQAAPPPPVHSPSGGFMEPLLRNMGGPGSCLVAALLSALLTWYGFHRYATVPLRRLRAVTQQLAGGDLSARVGEGLVQRRNEVADLGRDVDRMAERIESLVGAHQRLIRDVSHELRSPLARLNVALELARQSAGAGHSAPFDRIERESDRLNELIGQLLMLTKLENESATVQRTELDIATLIVETAQDVDFEAQSRDRRVVTSPLESLKLNGNRELLRQALENLVRNAVRYTAEGTAVEISLKRKDTGGRSWAHIEVRDQGPGVPEAALYDIFRPFYRVNDSRERQSGGTGVGLAISDRAVRLHGGSLRAFNAPGGGLIMEMELPLQQ